MKTKSMTAARATAAICGSLPRYSGLVSLTLAGLLLPLRSGLAQTSSFYSQAVLEGWAPGKDGNCEASQTTATVAMVQQRCVANTGVSATGKAFASLPSGSLAYSSSSSMTPAGRQEVGATARFVDIITITGPLPAPANVTLHLKYSGSISGSPNPSLFMGADFFSNGTNLSLSLSNYDGVSTDTVTSNPALSGGGYNIRSLVAGHIRFELVITKTVSDTSRDIPIYADLGGQAESCSNVSQGGCQGTSNASQVAFPNAKLSITLPPGLGFTSASGVLLTQ